MNAILKRVIAGCGVLVCLYLSPAMAQEVTSDPKRTSVEQAAENPVAAEPAPEKNIPAKNFSAEEIMDGVEKRYTGSGFTALFTQRSTIKAMEITDTASGKVFIKRPGMMRWEYEAPEKQIIITNGKSLWVFRPEDNQVMIGEAPAYFGDGKGGSFLSDIRIVREKFTVSIEKSEEPRFYRLKLVPKEKTPDIASVYLAIDKGTFDVVRMTTYNSYEDETLIEMSGLQFNQQIDDSVFRFDIPENADIVQIEE